MFDYFDDDFGWEDLAIALGVGEEIAKEELERLRQLRDEADYQDEIDDDLAWYEKE